ncbi:TPA: RICH domain-containing protein, partial [Streptococcus pneumoniae]
MFKSNHERRMRYSIRKFSVGVASVAVASLFMGSVVHATEKEGSTQAATSFNRGNGSQAEQRGELDLERDKAMKAVSEYVGKMVRDAYVKSDRKRHKNTVALVNQLGNIKNRYLNEIVHSTSKSQLQELMMKSQSEVDEAVSKFEKDSFSSSSSGSSTKPETP